VTVTMKVVLLVLACVVMCAAVRMPATPLPVLLLYLIGYV